MAASASIRQIGNVSIVDLKGRIMLGDGSGVIREAIQGLVAKGERNLLLNLAEVTYIDSSGLGEMAGSYISLVSQGGSIKLLNAAWLRDLLQITRLDTVFEAFTNENAAVASFDKATA
jgi:anti-sigma B factor antagonist